MTTGCAAVRASTSTPSSASTTIPAARSRSAAWSSAARIDGSSGPAVHSSSRGARGAHAAGSGSPVSAAQAHARSSTSAASKPCASRLGASPVTPSTGNRPRLMTSAAIPQKAAGRVTDPAVCDPSASGTCPAATAAADPLDDPPGV